MSIQHVLNEAEGLDVERFRRLTQLEKDTGLEREIETARLAGTKETDPELAREFFRAMAALIAQRSPGQIARMETQKGLR